MTREKIQELIFNAFIAFLGIIAPLLIPFLIILIFDLIDFVTGVRASHKKGSTFTFSMAMERTIDKLTGQGAALIVAFVLQKIFLNDLPLMKAIELAIIITQAQSIRENVKNLIDFDILKDTVNLLKRKK